MAHGLVIGRVHANGFAPGVAQAQAFGIVHTQAYGGRPGVHHELHCCTFNATRGHKMSTADHVDGYLVGHMADGVLAYADRRFTNAKGVWFACDAQHGGIACG